MKKLNNAGIAIISALAPAAALGVTAGVIVASLPKEEKESEGINVPFDGTIESVPFQPLEYIGGAFKISNQTIEADKEYKFLFSATSDRQFEKFGFWNESNSSASAITDCTITKISRDSIDTSCTQRDNFFQTDCQEKEGSFSVTVKFNNSYTNLVVYGWITQ